MSDPRLAWSIDQIRDAGLVRTTCEDCAHAVIVDATDSRLDTAIWCDDCLLDRQAVVVVHPIADTEVAPVRGQVISLCLPPPPDASSPPAPIPDIVETLRSMLARAEAGEIRDLGLAFHTADGATNTIIEGHTDSVRLLAAADMLHARIRQRVLETAT